MIAAWMLYCVAIGLVLTVVGVALERGLHLAGRPTRWAWVIAIAGSFAIPAAAWLRPEAFSTMAVPFPTVPASDPVNVAAPVGPDAQTMAIAATSAFSLRDLDAVLRWGWTASSILLLCVLGASALRLAALRRRWRASMVDGRRVLVSDNVGPAVAGLWRPVVIVPDWALALDQAQRRLMLSHEDEHLRAADPWLLACGAAALVLMPWNPALWWQVRRLRLAVEIDCDTRVLARGGTPPEYGELLLRVGQRRSQFALAAPALGEPVSFLERRIRRMMTRLPRWRWAGVAVALVVTAGAIVGACEAPRPVSPDLEARDAMSTVRRPMSWRLDSAFAAARRVDSGITRRNTLHLASRQAAAAVRQHFPELLQGREEPVYVWVVLGSDGRVLLKGTAARGLGSKMISTDMGARLIPGYDTLLARHADSYGVLGYGVLAPNSPPVMWVSLGSAIPAVDAQMDSAIPGLDARTDFVIARSDRFTIARRDPNPAAVSSSRTKPKDVYFDPSADVLRRLAHEYHPEAFVDPKPGTAIALVFDAQDQVVGHAAGVRIADDRDCTDVVRRLLPAFRYRRFLSAGCADVTGQRGPVIVYWESLRIR